MNRELNIRPEESLLLSLCRLKFTGELKSKIKALIAAVSDWNYFGSLANQHGVVALFCHNLKRLGFLDSVTESTASVLRSAFMMSLSKNAYNTDAMSHVLKLLNRENIKTVLLKGLALELLVYGNTGLRQMTDVDILIDREHCMLARQILINNGFVSLPVKSIFHKPIISSYAKHLPSLTKDGLSVEIHNELFGYKTRPLTHLLYSTSSETEIKGQRTYIPQPQIFFLYLVKHLHFHEMNYESQLRLYADLIVLIEKYPDEIINPELLSIAAQADMSKMLAWRLEPLKDLFGVIFHDFINDFINKWHNPETIESFIYFLKSPKNNTQHKKDTYYRHIVSDIPGLHRKFLFLLGDIFPTISFMKKRYKCKTGWRAVFYYPHRLGKILYLVKR